MMLFGALLIFLHFIPKLLGVFFTVQMTFKHFYFK